MSLTKVDSAMSGTNSATKTTTYAIAADDDLIPCDTTSAAFTTTLPTAVGRKGKTYTIKRVDSTIANALTIATTSSQTIDGVTTKKLYVQYEFITVQSDGANWHIVNKFQPNISFQANTSTTAGTTSQCFIYSAEDHDPFGVYDTSNGKFTCRVPGRWHFGGFAYAGATVFGLQIYKNGNQFNQAQVSVASNAPAHASMTLDLAIGDTIELRPTANATATGGSTLNSFYGFLVSAA